MNRHEKPNQEMTKEEYLEFIRAKLQENKDTNKNKLSGLLFLTNKLISDLLLIIENSEYQTIKNQYVISDNELDTFINKHFTKIFEWTNRIILHYKTYHLENQNKTYDEILKDEEDAINAKWERFKQQYENR